MPDTIQAKELSDWSKLISLKKFYSRMDLNIGLTDNFFIFLSQNYIQYLTLFIACHHHYSGRVVSVVL